MGMNRDCPWMTARIRCLGHVRGTAGEENEAPSVAATVTGSTEERGSPRSSTWLVGKPSETARQEAMRDEDWSRSGNAITIASVKEAECEGR